MKDLSDEAMALLQFLRENGKQRPGNIIKVRCYSNTLSKFLSDRFDKHYFRSDLAIIIKEMQTHNVINQQNWSETQESHEYIVGVFDYIQPPYFVSEKPIIKNLKLGNEYLKSVKNCIEISLSKQKDTPTRLEMILQKNI